MPSLTRGLGLAILLLVTGGACSSSSAPNGGGGGTSSLTVSSATPTSGNGALTGITVSQSALGPSEIEVIIKGTVGSEYHSFDVIVVTTTGAPEQIEHKWGASDPLNDPSPDGWTGCVDPNCGASFTVDTVAQSVSFSGLNLTGAGLGLISPHDTDLSTVSGTVYW